MAQISQIKKGTLLFTGGNRDNRGRGEIKLRMLANRELTVLLFSAECLGSGAGTWFASRFPRLKASNVIAWGEASDAQPQDKHPLTNPLSPARAIPPAKGGESCGLSGLERRLEIRYLGLRSRRSLQPRLSHYGLSARESQTRWTVQHIPRKTAKNRTLAKRMTLSIPLGW